MNKTPEELAEDWCNKHPCHLQMTCHAEGYLAGYEAAKDQYEAKLKEVSANWTFCCEDKARLLQEIAVASTMPVTIFPTSGQWISVKDRLPKACKLVLCCAVGKLDTTYGYIEEDKTWTCNDEPKYSLTKIDHISFITHWMPLPAAPKEKK
jgi:hypothetical protein